MSPYPMATMVSRMDVFLDQNPGMRIRRLTWLGIDVALVLVATAAYQWLGRQGRERGVTRSI